MLGTACSFCGGGRSWLPAVDPGTHAYGGGLQEHASLEADNTAVKTWEEKDAQKQRQGVRFWLPLWSALMIALTFYGFPRAARDPGCTGNTFFFAHLVTYAVLLIPALIALRWLYSLLMGDVERLKPTDLVYAYKMATTLTTVTVALVLWTAYCAFFRFDIVRDPTPRGDNGPMVTVTDRLTGSVTVSSYTKQQCLSAQ